MQIKPQFLAQHLQKNSASLYILSGQEPYFLDQSVQTIKSALKKAHEYDEKVFSIHSTDDWLTLIEEANSYSLFYDTVLLNIFYDKKSIDSVGKKVLTQYLKTVNYHCIIIIRAPNIPAKQLQWLSHQEQVVVVVAFPLNNEAMTQWVITQFKKNMLTFEQQVPDLIVQYTQGNMLACSQVLEKIALSTSSDSKINYHQALEHLSDQCIQSPFELIDACLLNQADKAIHILRQAAHNKTETTLILWMLTQEIRILLQLIFNIQHNTDFKNACSQLKIWPQRINSYQLAIKRLNNSLLKTLFSYCKSIDEQIKSQFNTTAQIWDALEKLALSLCLGQSLVPYE